MVAASHSQEVLLSGDEVLQRALEANTGLKISQAAFREAQGEFRQTHSLFLPEITASHTGIVTTNPLMAFGSKLNQEILTQADFNPALLNDPERTDNFEKDLYNITAQCTDALVEIIKKHPEQWIWIHNRWNTKPTEEDLERLKRLTEGDDI